MWGNVRSSFLRCSRIYFHIFIFVLLWFLLLLLLWLLFGWFILGTPGFSAFIGSDSGGWLEETVCSRKHRCCDFCLPTWTVSKTKAGSATRACHDNIFMFYYSQFTVYVKRKTIVWLCAGTNWGHCKENLPLGFQNTLLPSLFDI